MNSGCKEKIDICALVGNVPNIIDMTCDVD